MRVVVSRAASTAVATLLLVAAAACGGTAPSATGAGGPPGAGSTQPPVANGPPSPGSTLVLSEAANGTTVSATIGEAIRLELHSTYWHLNGSSDTGVLQPLDGTTVLPSPGCVPGAGCGSVTAVYRAVAGGRTELTASRTSCGEALACSPSQRTFAVAVVVRG